LLVVVVFAASPVAAWGMMVVAVVGFCKNFAWNWNMVVASYKCIG
jgi:hypothetical protein